MTTTISLPKRSSGGDELQRIVNVAKLHLTARFALLVLPWLILAMIFVANLAIWLLIRTAAGDEAMSEAGDGMQFSGASTFIFVYMMVVAVQAVNATFPFALGFGVTRRDFYLGSSLVFVALSAYFAAGLTFLNWVERSTNGWGLGGRMFDVVYFSTENLLTQFLQFFLVFLFFFFIGAATASVYVRWKSYGMIVFFIVLSFALIGAAAAITLTESWGAVGEWFVSNGPFGVALWLLVPTVLSALAGFRLLRRATPRN
ncbi:ABC transporter permease [Salinibacterium sp. dk2585]|uniref:ABC transporter permease n=1 Tax=unclassified Salinibacterium TaxID=2632331 RepID=UPI0011C24C05|nr:MULTISPECIES: ABC transporter permease [unclassified Salinibacterium]QEE61785.1 ABC transporter permease [Salinibacterium sp. dk2585]TXK54660.1 ABC transporter permease [Salinibacterium sp. dk5596]